MRARVFIDFWNFQLGWNEASCGGRCDWRAVPRQLVHEAEGVLAVTGNSEPLTVEETIVHASVNPSTEAKLSDWLTNWLDRQPSFDVKIRNRRVRKRPIYCKVCGTTATTCPSCQARLEAAVEKGVDAALVRPAITGMATSIRRCGACFRRRRLHSSSRVRPSSRAQGSKRRMEIEGARTAGSVLGQLRHRWTAPTAHAMSTSKSGYSHLRTVPYIYMTGDSSELEGEP